MPSCSAEADKVLSRKGSGKFPKVETPCRARKSKANEISGTLFPSLVRASKGQENTPCWSAEIIKKRIKAPSDTNQSLLLMLSTPNDEEHLCMVGCVHCGTRSSKIKACPQCWNVLYCSRSCQKKDEAAHKQECLSAKAFRKTRKDEAPAITCSADHQELMTYTEALLEESISNRGDSSVYAKLAMVQAHFLELSQHLDKLDQHANHRFQLLYTLILVKVAAFHLDLYGKVDPRGCLTVAERIRTRLQRYYAPNSVLPAAEGCIDAVCGSCCLGAGWHAKAKVFLTRALSLLDTAVSPRQLQTHVWEGALVDLISISRREGGMEGLLTARKEAVEKCADEDRRREIRVECAMVAYHAVLTLREEAQSLRNHRAMLPVRPPNKTNDEEERGEEEEERNEEEEEREEGEAGVCDLSFPRDSSRQLALWRTLCSWRRGALASQRKRREERAEELWREVAATLGAVEAEAGAKGHVASWSRAASLHAQFLVTERNDIDGRALAGQVTSVHACAGNSALDYGGTPCYDAALCEMVAGGEAIDVERLRLLRAGCPLAFNGRAWRRIQKSCKTHAHA